ncbi:MAG: glycosyltransferase family 2 protein [Lachnospiraceae bacterium]|nr:glycosyltransferase family 2 protein [Lachnospiraceae bacterium]
MSVKRKKVLIIIPAYNEGRNIGSLLEKLERKDISDICDVLVINDASTDDTGQVVRNRGHKIVRNIYNLGYGSGLQAGYRYAKRYDYSFVIQMDGDGQHDPENVLKIYDALTHADENNVVPDIVLGSRFLKDSPEYKSTLAKDMGYVLFRSLIKMFTGKKISDPTTGLQGLSRRTFCYYAGFDHFDDQYPDANMILQMIMLGYEVKEIPALMHQRTSGKSMHSGIKPIIYMIRMCYSIFAVWIRIKVLKTDKKVKPNDSLAS